MDFEIDRDAETVATPKKESTPTHADLLGVLESIQREMNDVKLTREREVNEWMRWRNGIDSQVSNLSEAWGEHGRKAGETAAQLGEIIRSARRIENMLLKRLYRDAAEGKEAEQELRDLG